MGERRCIDPIRIHYTPPFLIDSVTGAMEFEEGFIWDAFLFVLKSEKRHIQGGEVR